MDSNEQRRLDHDYLRRQRQGNGTVGYSVAANASTSSRTGTLTIAGQTFTVTQDGSAYPIILTSPSDQTSFDGCSFYSLPTFAWMQQNPLKVTRSNSLQVMLLIRSSVKVKTSNTQIVIPSNTWKKILLIPGGRVYWRVIGTRADKTQGASNVFSILIEAAQEVENPQISPTSKGSLPTLSWINHCNKKFKVWFGNDSQLSKKTVFILQSKRSVTDIYEGSHIKSMEFDQEAGRRGVPAQLSSGMSSPGMV